MPHSTSGPPGEELVSVVAVEVLTAGECQFVEVEALLMLLVLDGIEPLGTFEVAELGLLGGTVASVSWPVGDGDVVHVGEALESVMVAVLLECMIMLSAVMRRA